MDDLLEPIKVTYRTARTAFQASVLLDKIRKYDLFAADLEVATKYLPHERQAMQDELDTDPPKLRRIELESRLAATALDHPSHCTITHCSIAVSDHEAFVFILDNKRIIDLVLHFLTTTPIRQVWHNLSYDAKHIQYHTGQFPQNYEDTQILAKTLVNHVDTYKASTGLKDLAGKWYGSWAISSDDFSLDKIYDEHVLHYAAIDACATFKLWTELQSYIQSQGI